MGVKYLFRDSKLFNKCIALQDEVYFAVASVCKNLKDTLGEIVGSENYNFGPEVLTLQQEIRALQENITFVVARTSTNEQSELNLFNNFFYQYIRIVLDC